MTVRSLRDGPVGPLLVVALVAISWFASVPPLWDAVTRTPVPGADLHHPFGYLLVAPIFGMWDTVSLLTTSQHYAFIASMAVLYAGWRVAARVRVRGGRADRGVRTDGGRSHGGGRTDRGRTDRGHADGEHTNDRHSPIARRVVTIVRAVAREFLFAALALVALLAWYAAAALVPRPMAAIRLHDPDLVAVDFHSHTNYSHDGWSLFTVERRRSWHEAGGFHAAYITDHYTWEGVAEALPANPIRAGDRTVMLSGMELRMRNRHVNVLGDPDRYIFALDTLLHHLNPEALARGPDSTTAATHAAATAPPPTILYTIPGPLDQIVPFPAASVPHARADFAGVVGVELVDGAPRGLEQLRRQHDEVLALADSMNLAVVAGTNHHGWGRTVPAWSVMRLPGWRDMSPDAIGEAIEATLHRERRRAVTVVQRRTPHHGESTIALAASLPILLWEHFRMLTAPERMSWMLWAAAWWGGAVVRRRRRA